MKLIVGIGNPGKKYERTRHNVGFMVLDALHNALKENSINDWELSKKFNAQIAGCVIKGNKVVLAKPMTFMNRSGESVQLTAHYYQLSAHDIIVVHDDKDIVLGKVKIQNDKNDAGHNGVKSIIDHIGTKNIIRVRIGVASENEKNMKDTAKFVLNKFGILERKKIGGVIDKTVREIISLL